MQLSPIITLPRNWVENIPQLEIVRITNKNDEYPNYFRLSFFSLGNHSMLSTASSVILDI